MRPLHWSKLPQHKLNNTIWALVEPAQPVHTPAPPPQASAPSTDAPPDERAIATTSGFQRRKGSGSFGTAWRKNRTTSFTGSSPSSSSVGSGSSPGPASGLLSTPPTPPTPSTPAVALLSVPAERSPPLVIGSDSSIIDEALVGRELVRVFGLERPSEADAQRRASFSKKDLIADAERGEVVRLLPPKRANNVEIALHRLKWSNREIEAFIRWPITPAAGSEGGGGREGGGDGAGWPGQEESTRTAAAVRAELTGDALSALLQVMPSADEVESLRAYVETRKEDERKSGGRKKGERGAAAKWTFGRVEQFFWELSGIEFPERRLRALQVALQWDSTHDALAAHVGSVRAVCREVRGSAVLRTLLAQVLLVGNHLNGGTNRGGANGFKLSDLEKLQQCAHAPRANPAAHAPPPCPCATNVLAPCALCPPAPSRLA